MKKKILYVLIIVTAGIQFIRIDKTKPEINPSIDYQKIANVPDDVLNILKASCYDCHSNETSYPWYSNVAPVSWFLKNHINEAREHVNFSEWGKYTDEKQFKIREECKEEIEEEEMPLNSYTLMHSDAALDENKKNVLLTWFGNKNNNE